MYQISDQIQNRAKTSLCYQEFDGLAEKYMGIVKNANISRQVPYHAFVVYRNTPLSSGLASPMGILKMYAYVDLSMTQLNQSTLHQQKDMGDLNLHTSHKQNPGALNLHLEQKDTCDGVPHSQ